MSKQIQNPKSKIPKVTVVIVNYNTKEFLKRCITNLYGEGSYENLEIIVVDNSSTDGSLVMVKKEFPNVLTISSPNNGLACAFNQAFKKVPITDYYLLLGSDAFPKKGCIKCMVSYMQDEKDVGIATAKLVLKNGELDMDAHRGFPTPWTAITHFSRLNKIFPNSKIFNKYFREYEDFNKPHEIDMCISHFMMIRKSVQKSVGEFDESYWLYGEDVDYCYRVKQAGFKVMYLSNCESLHYKGVTVGVRKESKNITKATPETKKRARKASVDSMKIFYNKHYSKKYPKLVTYSVITGINLIALVRNKISNVLNK